MRRIGFLFIFIVGFAMQAAAQYGPTVLLKNVNVIGQDGKIRENVDVSIYGNVIRDVGPNLKPEHNQRVIDKTGKFVIPGLVDTRVQIALSPGNRTSRAELGEEQRIAWMHSMVQSGVTTARFIQGDITEHTGFKHFRTLSLLNGPWVVVSGPTFTAPDGRPANQYDVVAIATRERETSEVEDPKSAIDKARYVAHNGGDIFEIDYESGPDWGPAPRLKDDLLAIITKEAHGHDLRAFCWVGTNEEARTAIEKGCDVLEGFSRELVNDDLLKTMAAKKVAFVPSLAAQGYLLTEKTNPEALRAYLSEEVVVRALSPLMKKSFESPTGQIETARAVLARLVPVPEPPKSGDDKTNSGEGAQSKPPASSQSKDKTSASTGQEQSRADVKPQSDSTPQSVDEQHKTQDTAAATPNTPRPTMAAAMADVQARVRENVKRMGADGIPIVVGTGAGTLLDIPGASEHLEMQLLVEAGLTPLQALQAATSNAAYALGKPDDFGVIAKDKLADLLVLDANPLQDIRNTSKIDMVIRGGWVIDRENGSQY